MKWRDAGAGNGLRERLLHRRRARHRGMARDLGDRGGDAATFGDLFDCRADISDRRVARRVVRRAHVERELTTSGNDIDQPVRNLDLADGADQPRNRCAAPLDSEHDFGRGRGGVVAKRHRHRAGMTGDALNRDPASHDAGDRGDDAEGKIAFEELRSLFDMDFEIAAQRLRRPRQPLDCGEIDAALVQHCTKAYAIAVAALQKRGVETSGDRRSSRYRARRNARPPLRRSRSLRDETAIAAARAQDLQRRQAPSICRADRHSARHWPPYRNASR